MSNVIANFGQFSLGAILEYSLIGYEYLLEM